MNSKKGKLSTIQMSFMEKIEIERLEYREREIREGVKEAEKHRNKLERSRKNIEKYIRGKIPDIKVIEKKLLKSVNKRGRPSAYLFRIPRESLWHGWWDPSN